jgi:hypothetical protein
MASDAPEGLQRHSGTKDPISCGAPIRAQDIHRIYPCEAREAPPAEWEASGSPLDGGLKWFAAFGFPIVPRRASAGRPEKSGRTV